MFVPPLLQSAVQDLDYENELELLYVVVTLPDGEDTAASLCFIDDLTGRVTKTVPLPTWNHVREHPISAEKPFKKPF